MLPTFNTRPVLLIEVSVAVELKTNSAGMDTVKASTIYLATKLNFVFQIIFILQQPEIFLPTLVELLTENSP